MRRGSWVIVLGGLSLFLAGCGLAEMVGLVKGSDEPEVRRAEEKKPVSFTESGLVGYIKDEEQTPEWEKFPGEANYLWRPGAPTPRPTRPSAAGSPARGRQQAPSLE